MNFLLIVVPISAPFTDKVDVFYADCAVWFEIRENIQRLRGLLWPRDQNQEVILMGCMKKALFFFPSELFNCKRRFSWNLNAEKAPLPVRTDLFLNDPSRFSGSILILLH